MIKYRYLTLAVLNILFSFASTHSAPHKKQLSSDHIIFADDFETGIDPDWVMDVRSPNSVEINQHPVFQGTNALLLNYINGDNAEYILVSKSFDTQINMVLRGWFYDNMDTTLGTLFSCTHDENMTGLGVNTAKFPDHYFIRIDDYESMYNTGIERAEGWHMFELIVLDSGTYAKIDNKNINTAFNPLQTQCSQFHLTSTWNLTGLSYYDDIVLAVAPPYDTVVHFLSAHNELIDDYSTTDFSPLYPDLGRDIISEGRMHGNDLRSLLLTARAFVLEYLLTEDKNHLNRAQNLLYDAIQYGHWEEINPWSIAIPAHRLIQTVRLLWNDIPIQSKETVMDIITTVAHSFLTRNPATGFENDSRAEDNAWNASFLAAAYNFFPYLPNAEYWDAKARCFAFHTITTSEDETITHPERACGLNTQTVWDDFSLDNHGQHPSAVYTGATLFLLAEGAITYLLQDKPIPEEFKHNVTNLWFKYRDMIDWNVYQYTIPSDWSGANSAAFSGMPVIDYYLEHTFPSQADIITLSDVVLTNYLFYYQISSEYTDPVPLLDTFDQTSPGSDSYNWFLNNVVTNNYNTGFVFNHLQDEICSSFQTSITQTTFGQIKNANWKAKCWSGSSVFTADDGTWIYTQDPASAEIYSSLIPVQGNTLYTIEYNIKTENLTPDADTQVYGNMITAEYNASAVESEPIDQNRLTDGRGTGENVSGTIPWTQKSYDLLTTGQTRYIRVRGINGGWGQAAGSVWFDSVSVAIAELTILAHSDMNGSIEPSGRVDVPYGSDIMFTITPNPGYKIKDVLVDGESVGIVDEYAFTFITTDHTVEAVFEPDPSVTVTTFHFPQEGWYLISLPVIPTFSQISHVFPNMTSGSGYEWSSVDGCYNAVSELQSGKGYWIYILNPGSVDIAGTAFNIEYIELQPGWNLLGSSAEPLSPVGDPPDCFINSFIYYDTSNQTYEWSSVLEQHFGYWIYAFNSCTFDVESGLHTLNKPSSFSSITADYPDVNPQAPPPPPVLPDGYQHRIKAPENLKILSVYPNPFNSSTTIEYNLETSTDVKIEIFNISGSRVKTLNNGFQTAGRHQIRWDGTTHLGKQAASGVYLIRLTTKHFQKIQSCIYLR